MNSRRTVALGVAALAGRRDRRRRAGVGGHLRGPARGWRARRSQASARVPPRPLPPTPTGTGRPSTPATQDPTTGRQTWSDTPGYVTALCEGAAISAKATPNAGWRVEVDENGPRQVEVEFESADERTRMRVDRGLRRRGSGVRGRRPEQGLTQQGGDPTPVGTRG